MRYLIALFILFISQNAYAGSLFRLDMESNGTATAWAIDELDSGFTWEVITATNKTSELDLGWSFHPTASLTFTALGGATLEDERLGHAAAIFLVFYQDAAWQGEWWNVGLADPRRPHASLLYERAWLTWYHIGPFAEGTFPFDGVGSGVLGGMFTHSFQKADLQLSLGKEVGDLGGVASRLTLLIPL